MARKGKASKSADQHTATPEQNLSAILTNLIGMMTHISKRQEQLEATIIAALKKVIEGQESQGRSFVPLMYANTSTIENPDDQIRTQIEMPTDSMSDLRINHVHAFLEAHVKDIDATPDGVKNLASRLEKRIRWECQEKADELYKENDKLPSWQKLPQKKQLIRNITEEAESLGIPARRCEDLWPVMFLVKQHWSNKTRYRRLKRNRIKKRLLAKQLAKGTGEATNSPENNGMAPRGGKRSKALRSAHVNAQHPRELILNENRRHNK
ncbi:hypothetical protein BJV82DRAFT_675830 [Fennellomyces sp. T-0311]|nr:hypothetical protein BJV82DRAFT_675830 [Fennellomyces sp. T-0311]